MLGIEFKKLYSVSPASQQILLFECSLSQRDIRTSNVFNFDFQLWHRASLSSGQSRFISPLYLDHQSELTDLQPHQEKLFRLIWPYSDDQLEYLDNRISGERPSFEIKGRLLVQSHYPASANAPPRSHLQWEPFFSPPSFSGTFFVEQDPTQWAEVLTILNYRPRIYRDVSMLRTPGFRRAKEHIQNAWIAHRTGDHDGALQSCFAAFESLGFYLYGQPDLNRGDLLKKILQNSDLVVQKQLMELLKVFQGFLHLGRHETGPPIKLTAAESKTAIICSEVFLSYLEGYFQP